MINRKHLNLYLSEYKHIENIFGADLTVQIEIKELGNKLSMILNTYVLDKEEIEDIADYVKIFVIKYLLQTLEEFKDFINYFSQFITLMIEYFEKLEEFEICANIKNLNSEFSYIKIFEETDGIE